MKITLEPTPLILQVNGTECRQWIGTSDNGAQVVAFVCAIGVPENAPREQLEQFQRELRETVPTLGRSALLVFDDDERPKN